MLALLPKTVNRFSATDTCKVRRIALPYTRLRQLRPVPATFPGDLAYQMRTPRRCPFFVDGLPLYRPSGADRAHDDWIDFLADSHARYACVSGRRLYSAA